MQTCTHVSTHTHGPVCPHQGCGGTAGSQTPDPVSPGRAGRQEGPSPGRWCPGPLHVCRGPQMQEGLVARPTLSFGSTTYPLSVNAVPAQPPHTRAAPQPIPRDSSPVERDKGPPGALPARVWHAGGTLGFSGPRKLPARPGARRLSPGGGQDVEDIGLLGHANGQQRNLGDPGTHF